MARHPAHTLAHTVQVAAEELSGYLNDADPFPSIVDAEGYAEILDRIHWATAYLSRCVRHIAGTEGHHQVKEALANATSSMMEACGYMVASGSAIGSGPRVAPGTQPQPAYQVAAAGFPQPPGGPAPEEPGHTTRPAAPGTRPPHAGR